MELRPQIRLTLAFLTVTFLQTSSATTSFSAIQPIVGFSSSCTVAYNTPVSLCDIEDFRGIGGTGSCAADCQASLIASQTFVQRLCAGQRADANSVIGHLFVGDIVNFLCGSNAAATTVASQASTSARSTSSETEATTQTLPNTQTSSEASASATLSSSTTGSTSVATLSTSNTISSTKSSSTSADSATSSTSSASSTSNSSNTSSSTSSTSSSAAPTRDSNPQGSGGGSGGGSPFDGTFTSSATPKISRLHSLSLLCVIASVLALS